MYGLLATKKHLVIMSDKEKRLDIAVEEMLLSTSYSYCV
jgi:hypothetical protein